MEPFVCTKTRECERNNPFGVSEGDSFSWDNVDLSVEIPNKKTGKCYPGIDDLEGDMLVAFKTFQDGMNAAIWLLYDLYFSKGINTPRAIYNDWSGDTEAKAQAENRLDNGSKVSQIMGIDGDTKLNFVLIEIMALSKAMLRFEDSTAVFNSDLINIPAEMYQTAITYAESPED